MSTQKNLPRLAFIGAGRLATTVAMGWSRAGYAVTAACSRSRSSSQKLAARVPGCRVVDQPDDLLALADIVFVTTPDDSIVRAAQAVEWRAGIAVVHCSGATEVSALDAAKNRGALTGGFQPLTSFGDPDTALAALPGCTVGVEAETPLLGQLETLATALGCHALRIPPGVRGVYHASGGYASQFVGVLFAEAQALWRSFGATDEQSARALLPLLKSTVNAIERLGPIQSMPGPVSRGDAGTVAKHVESLAGVGEPSLTLYRELCGRSVGMALQKGSIDEAKAAAIRAVLKSPE
ncbi:MAG: DUF2520 domain-containing protein [Burkholderiales bacterium]